MLALFGDFYRKAYMQKKKVKVEPVQENVTKKVTSTTANGKNGVYKNGTNGSLINGLTKRANGVSLTSDTSNLLQRHLATSQQFDNI